MYVSFALLLFLLIGVASAGEVGNVSDIESSTDNSDLSFSNTAIENDFSHEDNLSSVAEDESLAQSTGDGEDVLNASNTKSTSFEVLTPTVINRDYFQVKLLDENGNALSKKPVSIEFKGKVYNKTTDANGIAKLKLIVYRGYYPIKYTFKGDKSYTSVSKSSQVLVVPTGATKLSGSNFIAYIGFNNYFTVTLTSDGVNVANQKVRFNLNGKNYYKTTDSKGQAKLNLKLKKGTYTIKYYFAGSKNLKASSGKATVTAKGGMPTKISVTGSTTYYHKVSAPFKVKVLDERGNPAKGKVVFSIINRQFTRELDDKGIASMNIKISQGSYKMTYTFSKNTLYQKSSGSKTIDVKSDGECKNNGYWIFGADMKQVNLDTLAKGNTKHIFLNFYALEAHGKTAVETFIKNANAKGISVHIWMQAFYEGRWISPLNSDGSYKYSYFNSKIKEAKEYAELKGVAGIHLDYLRFPGTAYKHSGGTAAINYFTKQFCEEIHKINSKLILSAAVMPEVDSNKYYYGQDIPTLSKYLDVIIPMVYKGNYESGTGWIKSTTAAIIAQSNGAEIWTGLQAYVSDDDVTPLSASELLKDCKSAAAGGATGVISFRWGISKIIDFDDI